tara:strand:- start:4047 stop:4643 length:597 start_codon:yes stop_codon:yes gene_type:complete
MTEIILKGLSHLDDLLVVSGLAYGIDLAALKASLKYNIPTLGVLAHGIDHLYPSMHPQLSSQMQETGALITADIANSYNRDVFAVPGRVGDENSEGCNQLIPRNQAALVQSASDICYLMAWDDETDKKTVKPIEQKIDLNKEEASVLSMLNHKGEVTSDLLAIHLKLPISKIIHLLFQLELKGLVKAIPENRYSKSYK